MDNETIVHHKGDSFNHLYYKKIHPKIILNSFI